MLVRIVITAALIAVALGVIQKRDVLQRAGLTGYCTTVPTPAGESTVGTTERWRCPTALEPNTARQ